MNKYKLINSNTKKETFCNKVTVDGYDYWFIDKKPKVGDWYYYKDDEDYNHIFLWSKGLEDFTAQKGKLIIATNNTNIDCCKVLEDAELRDMLFVLDGQKIYTAHMTDINSQTALGGFLRGCKHGYNKFQETHPFSDEDMIDFYEWCDTSEEATIFWRRNRIDPDMSGSHHQKIKEKRKELLQLWKEQQPIKLYYE